MSRAQPDPQAEERRLRPLYDAIDLGQYKNALKIADAALKKQPTSQITKALKAVTLQRMGRKEEALELLDDMQRETCLDDHTLSTMALVYKATGNTEKLVSLYENAAKAEPGNVQHLNGMFGGLLRLPNFVKMQQVSMKLYKLTNSEEKFLLWAALCSVLQSREAPDEAAATKLLSLASSLVSRRAASSTGLETEEALYFFLHILDLQGDDRGALDAMKGPLGGRMTIPSERARTCARLQHRLALHADALASYSSILHNNPDDWDALQGALSAALPLSAPDAQIGEVDVDAGRAGVAAGLQAAAEVVASARARAEGEDKWQRLRGPRLAEVELELRRLRVARRGLAPPLPPALPAEYSPPDEAAPGLVEPYCWGLAMSLYTYWERCGHIVSCAADTRHYAREVAAHEPAARWLAGALAAHWADDQPPPPDPVPLAPLRRRIAALLTARTLEEARLAGPQGAEEGAEEGAEAAGAAAGAAEEAARDLMALYSRALHLYEGADPRERGPGDDLPLLAAHSLMHAHRCLRRAALPQPASDFLLQRPLVQAACCLEAGLARSPHNADLRLALVSLYSLLGAPPRAQELFASLDVKYIQLDTMPQHILPALLGLGQWDAAAKLCDRILHMHSVHDRDAGESILLAFNHGTYTKVGEFFALKQRLYRSHLQAVARCEAQLLAVRAAVVSGRGPAALEEAVAEGAAAAGVQSVAPARLAALRFNEDWATQCAWQAPPRTSHAAALHEWWHGPRAPAWGEGVRESTPAQQAAWRGALRSRTVVLHLLHCQQQLLGQHGAGASPPDLQKLHDQLTSLLKQLQACHQGAVGAEAAGGAAVGDGNPASSEEHSGLVVALFQAASSLAAALLSPRDPASAPASEHTPAMAQAQQALQRLRQAMEEACSCAAAECQAGAGAGGAAGAEGPLPVGGRELARAGLLVGDALQWAAACVVAWTAGLQAKASKRKKKKDQGAPPAPVSEEVQAGVAAVREALCGGLRELRGALAARHTPRTERQQQMALTHAMRAPPSWPPAPPPSEDAGAAAYGPEALEALDKVVEEVIKGQRTSVETLIGHIDGVLRTMAALSS